MMEVDSKYEVEQAGSLPDRLSKDIYQCWVADNMGAQFGATWGLLGNQQCCKAWRIALVAPNLTHCLPLKMEKASASHFHLLGAWAWVGWSHLQVYTKPDWLAANGQQPDWGFLNLFPLPQQDQSSWPHSRGVGTGCTRIDPSQKFPDQTTLQFLPHVWLPCLPNNFCLTFQTQTYTTPFSTHKMISANTRQQKARIVFCVFV